MVMYQEAILLIHYRYSDIQPFNPDSSHLVKTGYIEGESHDSARTQRFTPIAP